MVRVSSQVKEHYFSIPVGRDSQQLFFAYGRAVACAKRLAVERDPSAQDLKPRMPAIGDRMLYLLSIENRREKDAGILVDQERSIGAILGSDQPQSIATLI